MTTPPAPTDREQLVARIDWAMRLPLADLSPERAVEVALILGECRARLTAPPVATGDAAAEAVLPHSLFAEAMRAGECCAICVIDVFRRQRQAIFDGEVSIPPPTVDEKEKS